MTDHSRLPSGEIAARVRIMPIGLDDWSAVRHLHAASIKRQVLPFLDADASVALSAIAESPEYTEDLQSLNLQAAWLDGHMVGTCGWTASSDLSTSARISGLFVDPLFVGLGIGRVLVADAEARAEANGYRVFNARATDNAVGFFVALGYELTSQGTSLLAGVSVPVTFLRKSPSRTGDIEPVTDAKEDADTLIGHD